MPITREYRSFFFVSLVARLGIFGTERAAELHGAESEAVAQPIGGARQLFEFGAAFRGEQIELLRTMRQAAQAHTKQADFAPMIAVGVKKLLKCGKNVRIELGRFTKRLRACVRIEASVTNGERKSARGQASFAKALASLLRKVTEHRS